MVPLRRCYRLKKRKEFAHVFTSGRSAAGRLMVVYNVEKDGPGLRIGFSAGKKIGNAVKRNRVRRRLKEVVRSFLPYLRRGRHLVVIARYGALKATKAELEKDFQFVSKRLKLWCES